MGNSAVTPLKKGDIWRAPEPIHMYLFGVRPARPGIYHAYYNGKPFMWAYVTHRGCVATFFTMTGADVPLLPCTIEIRETSGRP